MLKYSPGRDFFFTHDMPSSVHSNSLFSIIFPSIEIFLFVWCCINASILTWIDHFCRDHRLFSFTTPIWLCQCVRESLILRKCTEVCLDTWSFGALAWTFIHDHLLIVRRSWCSEAFGSPDHRCNDVTMSSPNEDSTWSGCCHYHGKTDSFGYKRGFLLLFLIRFNLVNTIPLYNTIIFALIIQSNLSLKLFNDLLFQCIRTV